MDCSFIVRDMGDAQFLGLAARELHSRGHKVRLMALGQAAQALIAKDPELDRLSVSLDGVAQTTRLGAEPNDFGGGQGHRVAFAPSDAARTASALAAPLIVTGVVSRGQEELIEALLSRRGAERAPYVVGVYDSLALNKHCFLFDAPATLAAPSAPTDKLRSRLPWVSRPEANVAAQAALAAATPSFAAQLDELWVPLVGLVAGVSGAARLPSARVHVVGHPPTQGALERLAGLEAQRATLRARLGVNPRDQLIFYAGGRDQPGKHSAARSMEYLLRGALVANAPPLGRRIVVAGLHPASPGTMEQDLLMLLEPAIQVQLIRTVQHDARRQPDTAIASEQAFSAEELTIAADVVATFNSTVGSQAALYGLRSPVSRTVLFVDGDPQRDTFAVVEQGLATQAPDILTVARQIGGAAHAKKSARLPQEASRLLDDLGSYHALADRLEALLP